MHHVEMLSRVPTASVQKAYDRIGLYVPCDQGWSVSRKLVTKKQIDKVSQSTCLAICGRGQCWIHLYTSEDYIALKEKLIETTVPARWKGKSTQERQNASINLLSVTSITQSDY